MRTVRGNVARWINHGCEPNCEAFIHEHSSGKDPRKDQVIIEALRDIEPGRGDHLRLRDRRRAPDHHGGAEALGLPVRLPQVPGHHAAVRRAALTEASTQAAGMIVAARLAKARLLSPPMKTSPASRRRPPLASTPQRTGRPEEPAIVDRLIAKNKSYTSFEADFTSRLQDKAAKLDVKQEGNVKVKGKKFRLQLDGQHGDQRRHDPLDLQQGEQRGDDQRPRRDGHRNWTRASSSPSTRRASRASSWRRRRMPTGVMVQIDQALPAGSREEALPHGGPHRGQGESWNPDVVQVLYKDGNVVTYTLKKFTPNVELADALFIFDKSKYPGVEVNDMR